MMKLVYCTSKNRSPEAQNKTRGPTLFFHFPHKEIDIFSVNLSATLQVMTINDSMCIRGVLIRLSLWVQQGFR